MSSLRFIWASVMASALLTLCGCADPEKDANKLLVESANLIRDIASATPMQRYGALQEADKKIRLLTSPEYATTSAAVRVASGEKIGGKSIEEVRSALRDTAAEKEVCSILKTKACAIDHIVGAAMSAASDKKLFVYALALSVRLQAAGLDQEATRISDTAISTITKAFPGKEENIRKSVASILSKVTKSIMPSMLRRQGPDATVAFIDKVSQRIAPEERSFYRNKNLLDFGTELIDPITNTIKAQEFLASITDNEGRQWVAYKFLSNKTPSSPDERELIDRLFLPMQGSLEAGTRRTLLESWIKQADPRQFAALLPLADTAEAKSSATMYYLGGAGRDLAPRDWLALANSILPDKRWVMREDYLTRALKWRAQPTLSREALLQAHALASKGYHAEDNDNFKAHIAVVERLMGPPLTEADLDALLDVYALRKKTVYTGVGICQSIPDLLVEIDRKALVPRAAATCLEVYASALAADKFKASVASAATAPVSIIWDLGRPTYETWKAGLIQLNLLHAWNDWVSVVLGNQKGPEGKAEADRILADSGTDQKERIRDRERWEFLNAVGRNDPDAMKRWDEFSENGAKLSNFLTMPTYKKPWKDNNREFFMRLIQERPEQVASFLKKDFTDGDPGPLSTVAVLGDEELSAALPLLKDGQPREFLIQSAILNGDLGKGQLSPDLAWRTDAPGNWFTLHLSELLLSGALNP